MKFKWNPRHGGRMERRLQLMSPQMIKLLRRHKQPTAPQLIAVIRKTQRSM